MRPDSPPIRILGYHIETVLAEKLATAIALGPATTRVRDYADIYTLTGTHELELERVRDALVRTARFRDTTIRPLSAVIVNLVDLRAATYSAYRRSLGPAGQQLPEDFADVVANVVPFADPITNTTPRTAVWEARARRWTP